MNERIEKLRRFSLERPCPSIRSREGELLYWRGCLPQNQPQDYRSAIERKASAKSYMLRNSTPVIGEGELLVGKPCFRSLSGEEEKELNQYDSSPVRSLLATGGQGSHMAIDYPKLLSKGIRGIAEEIETLRSRLSPAVPEELEKECFYLACLESLSGVTDYAERYRQEALRQAEDCVDPRRAVELRKIAQVLSRVPYQPAESFWEALQSVWFVTFCLEGLYQLGRPDRYLIDYYRNDLSAGRITKEQAQELLDCLCVLFNEITPQGLAVGFMVGGRDETGQDCSNELSAMLLQCLDDVRLVYPGIGLCWNQDTPEELLRQGCQLLAKGYSHPAIFNDEVISQGLRDYGVPSEEACSYINCTCVEITPVSSSAVWVASPYINLLQPLLDEMESANPAASFEQLKERVFFRLSEKIRREVAGQNLLQMDRSRQGFDPLVSCFVKDCLARGRDIDQGGARYNWIMPSFVGVANLADSLYTVKELVYTQRRLTLRQFSDILWDNFEHHIALRQEIANRYPKYGNDDDRVDGLVQEITQWIPRELRQYTTYRGDRFIPSLFCWVMHERLGRDTQASPDGRCLGFPLGDGSGPAQGREKEGPTASILSSTKWKHSPFIGGIAVNMKFNKGFFTGESLEKMLQIVKTYLRRGGFEIQLNDGSDKRAYPAFPSGRRSLYRCFHEQV